MLPFQSPQPFLLYSVFSQRGGGDHQTISRKCLVIEYKLYGGRDWGWDFVFPSVSPLPGTGHGTWYVLRTYLLNVYMPFLGFVFCSSLFSALFLLLLVFSSFDLPPKLWASWDEANNRNFSMELKASRIYPPSSLNNSKWEKACCSNSGWVTVYSVLDYLYNGELTSILDSPLHFGEIFNRFIVYSCSLLNTPSYSHHIAVILPSSDRVSLQTIRYLKKNKPFLPLKLAYGVSISF